MTPNWLDYSQGVYCRIWLQVNRPDQGKIGGRYLR